MVNYSEDGLTTIQLVQRENLTPSLAVWTGPLEAAAYGTR